MISWSWGRNLWNIRNLDLRTWRLKTSQWGKWGLSIKMRTYFRAYRDPQSFFHRNAQRSLRSRTYNITHCATRLRMFIFIMVGLWYSPFPRRSTFHSNYQSEKIMAGFSRENRNYCILNIVSLKFILTYDWSRNTKHRSKDSLSSTY